MELTGKIKLVFDLVQINPTMNKREFVVTTDERYAQDILLETFNEKTSILDPFKAGDLVRVSFDIRGREYNGRYYNNLRAWKVESLAPAAPAPQGGSDMPPPPQPIDTIDDPIEDDLPF